MISFNMFKKCIMTIKEVDEKENILCTVLLGYAGELSGSLQECVVELLTDDLGDNDDLINWWLYDSSPKVFTYPDGSTLDVTTLEAFYTYLTGIEVDDAKDA